MRFFGLFITWMLVSSLHAQTIAYRDDSSNLYVLHSASNYPITIARVTRDYKVGQDLVAYLKSKALYIASVESNWKPVEIARNVDSFRVDDTLVSFRDDNTLYIVRRHVKPVWAQKIHDDIDDYQINHD